MQDWYREKRESVEQVFETATPLLEKTETHKPPSGTYSLEITPYSTGPKTWSFSRGIVRRTANGEVIADVKRNFGHFPYSWCESHPNGHDYLICGEDYQGQTVIELDTGQRMDHIPEIAEKGFAFCWTAHYPSPDGKHLFVDGCVWAAPYEMILFDFRDPMNLPYPEIQRWPVWEVRGFQPDGTFVFEYQHAVRKSDEKALEDMEETELDAFEDSEDFAKLSGEKTIQVTWHPDGTETLKDLGFVEDD